MEGNYILIVTAGGIGRRFCKPYPKQFEKIGDKRLIELTLGFFSKIKPQYCVLTYPGDFKKECEYLTNYFSFPVYLVKGGNERFHSVKNAIDFIYEKEEDKSKVVIVHDGVRPFLNLEVVKKIIEKTAETGCAVPFIPISGTVRRLNDDGFYETLIRKDLVTVTTPQGARLGILKDCFDKSNIFYTDESTMLTEFGYNPYPIKDWHFNIKITEPEDKETAEMLVKLLQTE
ncbi:2-C-methyl-D-erythritol 4-phosphate cytidylyltransferase [Thermotomaculum hydrothermale]|uniref:2-C-methyl-D-erythritol 4-phosphate cytidylyltransferase n=1 Tax=Thermotomaculum hydrothermale TaxID=981385 RepID=A0A7R6SZ09_9BACT|nr:IspD/TarI family cytidylyltransferase [Thermotomaculum hydrothermale]BBB33359.1 2-C-methyl-D-erythritol 4-phosphate cytidylyltransferase [Thermotomaculum hydrothermale]